MKLKLLIIFILFLPCVFATERIVGINVDVNTTGTGNTIVAVEGGNVWEFSCLTNFSTSQNITKTISFEDNSSAVCDEKIGNVNAYCKDILTAFNRTYSDSFLFVHCQSNMTYLEQKVKDLENSSSKGNLYDGCIAQLQAKTTIHNDCTAQKKKLEEDASNTKVQLTIAFGLGAVVCYFIMRVKKPKNPAEEIPNY